MIEDICFATFPLLRSIFSHGSPVSRPGPLTCPSNTMNFKAYYAYFNYKWVSYYSLGFHLTQEITFEMLVEGSISTLAPTLSS